jgi:fatty-acyl-CoA synthase/long-chain acyl-CoA synthetase
VTAVRSLTFSQLDAESTALAASLRRRGIAKGDSIALHLRNCAEYVIADLAILKLGAVKIPLNELMGVDELSFCLEHASVRALVRHSDLPEASRKPACLIHTLSLASSLETPIPLDEQDSEAGNSFERAELNPGDVAVIAYTGGTTGKPKGVLHIQSTLAVNQFAHIVCGDVRSDEHMLLVTPLPHSAGYHLQACLIQGGCAILASKFDPASFVETCRRHRVTWTFAVPTMIYRLLDYLQTHSQPLTDLRTFVYGAAPMSLERLEEALVAFGPVFIQIYGQTECPNFITTLSKEDHLDRSLLSSCGRPVPFLGLTLHDTSDAGVGEIEVRSPYNLVEYYRNAEATQQALVGGALRTGDLARIDDRGFVFLVDRAKDMIISGGFNVFPSDLEQVVGAHPEVMDVTVIGIPHERWGETPLALVIRRPGASATEAELLGWANERLGKHQRLGEVAFRDEFPRNALGKVLKKDLRAPYWAAAGRTL